MTELNENNKDNCSLTKKTAVKEENIFLAIKYSILSSLVFGYLFYLTIRSFDYIPFLYSFLIGLGIGRVIFYGIRENRYNNKKLLLILIIGSSFLIYLTYNMILYYKDIMIDGEEGFLYFLWRMSFERPFSIYSCSPFANFILQLIDLFLPEDFFYLFRLDNEASMANLQIRAIKTMTLNISMWIIDFVISASWAWIYLTGICPWLSKQNNQTLLKNCSNLRRNCNAK